MHLYPIKRILVCTDFSDSSNLALKAAEELRGKCGGTIHLLHVSELGLKLNSVLSESLTYKDLVLGSIREYFKKKLPAQIQYCEAHATQISKDGNLLIITPNLLND